MTIQEIKRELARVGAQYRRLQKELFKAEKVTNMTYDEFKNLPSWQQDEMRKLAGMFGVSHLNINPADIPEPPQQPKSYLTKMAEFSAANVAARRAKEQEMLITAIKKKNTDDLNTISIVSRTPEHRAAARAALAELSDE